MFFFLSLRCTHNEIAATPTPAVSAASTIAGTITDATMATLLTSEEGLCTPAGKGGVKRKLHVVPMQHQILMSVLKATDYIYVATL